MPASLTDREFWDFFTTMSEEGGSFPSENFVSNEQTYQYVIPTLQRTFTPGGVYLGVGPEQNFTYIANLKPRMAVIFDIRRQNAMAHLMYKALFELSPTRADFLSHFFRDRCQRRRHVGSAHGALRGSRRRADERLGVRGESANDPRSAHRHTRIRAHRGGHPVGQSRVCVILRGGTGDQLWLPLRRSSRIRVSMFSTYAEIQTLTNAEGVNMAFLATEENYQSLRALHVKNLVIPVVGDFAGPKAIRSVGEYLKQRHATVAAFYLSNVEQYLFRGAATPTGSTATSRPFPLDSTSMFIRSVPPNNGPFGGERSPFSAAAWQRHLQDAYYSVSVETAAASASCERRPTAPERS